MLSLCDSDADSFRGTLSVSVHAHFAGKFSNCPAQCPHRARISPELTEVRRRKVQSCTRCSGMALSRKTGNQPRVHNYKVHVGNRREFGMGGEENRFIFPSPELLFIPRHRETQTPLSVSLFLPIQSCGSVDFLSQALMPYDSPAIRPSVRATYRTLPSLRRCFSQHFLVAFQQSREKVHPQSSGQVPKRDETNHKEPSNQSTGKHHPKQYCLPHHTIPLTRPDFPLANRTDTAPWERRRERGEKEEGGRVFAHPKMISEEARDLAAAKATIFLIASGQHHSER